MRFLTGFRQSGRQQLSVSLGDLNKTTDVDRPHIGQITAHMAEKHADTKQVFL